MFCPVCKSEYRDGFTKCSDCGVDLVKQLADDSSGEPSSGLAGCECSQESATARRAKILHQDDSVRIEFMPTEIANHDQPDSVGIYAQPQAAIRTSSMLELPNLPAVAGRRAFWIGILSCLDKCTETRSGGAACSRRVAENRRRSEDSRDAPAPADTPNSQKTFPTISSESSTRTTPHRRSGPVQMAGMAAEHQCLLA